MFSSLLNFTSNRMFLEYHNVILLIFFFRKYKYSDYDSPEDSAVGCKKLGYINYIKKYDTEIQKYDTEIINDRLNPWSWVCIQLRIQIGLQQCPVADSEIRASAEKALNPVINVNILFLKQRTLTLFETTVRSITIVTLSLSVYHHWPNEAIWRGNK